MTFKTMKYKHLHFWIEMALMTSRLSECPRRHIGTVIFNPVHNTVVSTGYNGTPRGSTGNLCGGNCCLRDSIDSGSGKEMQIGCVHSELNAICNAARVGIATLNCHAVLTGAPCLACAKALFQSGIAKVYVLRGGYPQSEGIDLLRSLGLPVEEIGDL